MPELPEDKASWRGIGIREAPPASRDGYAGSAERRQSLFEPVAFRFIEYSLAFLLYRCAILSASDSWGAENKKGYANEDRARKQETDWMFDNLKFAPKDEDEMEDFRDYGDEGDEVDSKARRLRRRRG